MQRINPVGRRLTFMDRNELYEQIWQTFLTEKNSSTTDRTKWPLQAIVGTPGSGKTRFMAEVLHQPHQSVAKHFQHYLYIHATYNNGNEVTDIDRKAPARCLALRLLYHYFIEGPPNVCLDDVFGDLYELTKPLDESSFSIRTALALIREDYILTHNLGDDVTFNIAIGLDEYNKFLTGAPGESSSFEIRQIVKALGRSKLCPPSNTRIYVLLAGTSRRSIIDAGHYSTFPICPHRLDPLSETSALTIIANYFESNGVYTNACMRNLLLDIGGHPRTIESLVIQMSKYSSVADVNWTIVRQVLAKSMATSWDGTSKVSLENVIIAMVKRAPQSSDEIPGCNSVTFDSLEQRELGLRFDQYNVPYWPYLSLHAWTEQTSGHNERFHSMLRYTLESCTDGDLFTRQHFERFCAQYLALRIAAFGEGQVHVHTLLRGAVIAKDVQDYELIIPKHTKYCGRVLTANKTFPSKRTLVDERGMPINWCNTGRVVVNNEGAPFDFFVNFAVEGLENGFFICGRTKYYNTAQLTLEQVETSVNKVKKAMKKAHLKHWMLLVVTTSQCDFREEELPARCAVVSARQFEHFFAKPFAERVL